MTSPRCPSCKVPFDKHLGLAGTCAELLDAKDAIKRLAKLYRDMELYAQKVAKERDNLRRDIERLQNPFLKGK